MGSRKWEVGSGKWEVGSRKWEVGSGKLEVGSWRWEVGVRVKPHCCKLSLMPRMKRSFYNL